MRKLIKIACCSFAIVNGLIMQAFATDPGATDIESDYKALYNKVISCGYNGEVARECIDLISKEGKSKRYIMEYLFARGLSLSSELAKKYVNVYLGYRNLLGKDRLSVIKCIERYDTKMKQCLSEKYANSYGKYILIGRDRKYATNYLCFDESYSNMYCESYSKIYARWIMDGGSREGFDEMLKLYRWKVAEGKSNEWAYMYASCIIKGYLEKSAIKYADAYSLEKKRRLQDLDVEAYTDFIANENKVILYNIDQYVAIYKDIYENSLIRGYNDNCARARASFAAGGHNLQDLKKYTEFYLEKYLDGESYYISDIYAKLKVDNKTDEYIYKYFEGYDNQRLKELNIFRDKYKLCVAEYEEQSEESEEELQKSDELSGKTVPSRMENPQPVRKIQAVDCEPTGYKYDLEYKDNSSDEDFDNSEGSMRKVSKTKRLVIKKRSNSRAGKPSVRRKAKSSKVDRAKIDSIEKESVVDISEEIEDFTSDEMN